MGKHVVDVYYANRADGLPIDPETSARQVFNYVEILAAFETIPWGKWFAYGDRQKLEDVCKHVLLDTYHPNEKQHFWNSLGHWRRQESFFEDNIINVILRDGPSIPEHA